MRRGRSISEIAVTIEAGPVLVARALRAVGLHPDPSREYRLADVSRGLAVLVNEAEKRSRASVAAREFSAPVRVHFTGKRAGESSLKIAARIVSIVKASLSRFTSTPAAGRD